MKFLAIVKDTAKSNDIIINTDGKPMPFKSFVVINFARSIAKIEKGELQLILKKQLLNSDRKKLYHYLDNFDMIISYGFKQKLLVEYYKNNTKKFIFIEQPVMYRKIHSSFKDQNYIRVMKSDLTGTNFISKYSNGTIRNGFYIPQINNSIKYSKKILLVNQVVGDIAVIPDNPYDWVHSVLNVLNTKHHGKNVIIREHPSQFKLTKEEFSTKILTKYKNIHIEISINKEIKQDLENAACTITFSSGAALDSLIEGVPVITMDKRSFLYEITSHSLDDFDTLFIPNLENFFSAISNTHFRLHELINGDCWLHLKGILKYH